MDGFDSQSIFFSDPLLDPGTDSNEKSAAKKQFRNFLREFHEGNYNYKYRNALKLNYNQGNYYVDVNLEDLSLYDEALAEKVYKEPTEYLPIFEEAAKRVADEVTTPRPQNETVVHDIQVLLSSEGHAHSLRSVKSNEVSRIVKISGIVVSASYIRSKASKIAIKCRNCKDTKTDITIRPGLEGYMFPRKCAAENNGPNPCPLDPYFIDPDKCKCVDYQTIKLQELTESVPQGEMPRHMQMYCERYLCDRIMPGNKVVILGIFCIKKVNKTNKTGSKENSSTGVRMPYVRVLGIKRDDDDSGTSIHPSYTAQEEEEFIRLAHQPDIYERIARSVAPSIYGANDMKKAIACLLFGGSRKRLPDGLCRRGDINVLMLGDPGTAKSQLLKFVERVAPIGIYTSGKGSSAAGLTASVNRDPATKNFVMEGGAMVLADGGVVCIDEFDKMREDDRVAIHEAMEQQTISIAKAGITTTLNTRCSILAAANPIKGTWEDDSNTDDNINFMPTILSRFDMIFIVKDEHNSARDQLLSKHIMSLHMNAGQLTEEHVEGELPLKFFKKYIHYCRKKVGPRLSEEAGEKLKNQYVMMRTTCSDRERDTDKRGSINITVRQLEAVVRISEAIAKMKLKKFAEEEEVDEALRLFQVSTLSAVDTGSLAGCEGFQRKEDIENLQAIEIKMKQRFPIGSTVPLQDILNEFANRYKFPETLVRKVIQQMVRRDELQRRRNNTLLYRLH